VKDHYPTFDDHNGYHLADDGMKYLNINVLVKTFAVSQMRPSVPDLGTFLKMSTNNIYSCVQPGTAQQEFFCKFGVEKKYLLPHDINQAQELLPQLVKATVVSPATTAIRTKYPSSLFNSGNLIHTARDLDQIGISSEVRGSVANPKKKPNGVIG
jgi:hypothetical protein